MLEFRPYTPQYYSIAIEIFDSNVPDFVHPEERSDLHSFLTEELDELSYYIAFLDGKGIGMCGYYFDEKKNAAALCWGLIHRSYHGKRFGEEMLRFRIGAVRNISPGAKITCRTSQVTEGFFAKYGFKTVHGELDYWGEGLHLREMELLPQ